MNSRNPLAIIVLISLFLSGCAGIETSNPLCVIAGGAIGAGVGVAADDDEAGIIAAGAIVGSVIGYLVCGQENEADEVRFIDSDGDGVGDSQDQCPNSPRGSRVNSVGCPLDSDNDGVIDDEDKCPNTPRGRAVNSDGCQLDSDGDGVYDADDECPDTPKGQAVNDKGCHIIFSLDGVNFETNSAELTAAATSKLNEAAEMLKANSALNVRVEGHTDDRGAESYNQQLSQRRAESVVDYLAGKGINRSRMSPKGYGESTPAASNDTREGRAQNRRVDLAIDN